MGSTMPLAAGRAEIDEATVRRSPILGERVALTHRDGHETGGYRT